MIKKKSSEIALLDLNSKQGSKIQKEKELVMAPYFTSSSEDFSLKNASFIAET